MTMGVMGNNPKEDEGRTLSDMIQVYGEDFTLERIDFEYCIGKSDKKTKTLHDYYLNYPYKCYYIAKWDNMDNSNDTLSIYVCHDDDDWRQDYKKYQVINENRLSYQNMDDVFSKQEVDSVIEAADSIYDLFVYTGKKRKLTNELDIKYYDPETQYIYYNKVNWDSLDISNYSFQRLFKEFGRPCSKEKIYSNISTIGILGIDIQVVLNMNPNKYCVYYTWCDLPNSKLKLSVAVLKTDKGMYPVSGILYGPDNFFSE